ncbi:Tetraspanin/Peripherin [Phytophthora cactorum]|nr:Tetraspanin/Peripherin [Phytophthora cactorum]
MHAWRSLSRSILVFTNVLFLLLGSVLVSIGGYMASLPALTEFSDGGVASSVIMCGSLIILIALLGCCGAQWESKVFLFPYAILVLVSVVAQLSLAGFLTHVHSSLVEVARHNFDLSVLAPADQETLRWINKRFKYVYYGCGFDVDIDLTGTRSHRLSLHARTQSSAAATEGSNFLKCAGPSFSLSNAMTEHTMLCACETRMISWVNDQSLLVAVFVFVIVSLEIMLEITMPVRQQPYNPHPRNYFGQQAGQRQPLNAHPVYTSYGPSGGENPYAAAATGGKAKKAGY